MPGATPEPDEMPTLPPRGVTASAKYTATDGVEFNVCTKPRMEKEVKSCPNSLSTDIDGVIAARSPEVVTLRSLNVR